MPQYPIKEVVGSVKPVSLTRLERYQDAAPLCLCSLEVEYQSLTLESRERYPAEAPYRRVAQWLEHRADNAGVVSSILTPSTRSL